MAYRCGHCTLTHQYAVSARNCFDVVEAEAKAAYEENLAEMLAAEAEAAYEEMVYAYEQDGFI